MLMKNSIIDTTEFNSNSVIVFIGTKDFSSTLYHGQRLETVKMLYSLIYTFFSFASVLYEYLYTEFKETNPYNM